MRPRRLKHRRGARVIIIADDQVLLVQDSDPGVPGSRWWVTPGGGIDGVESDAEAAAREIREETGLECSPADLAGPVARRVAVHGYSDRILIQQETFFRAAVDWFEPRPLALSAKERTRMKGMAWHPVGNLPAPLWPANLHELIDSDPRHVRDLGQMDESTVPVTPGDWQRLRKRLGDAAYADQDDDGPDHQAE